MDLAPGAMDEVLRLLTAVCEPGFDVCTWQKSEKREIDGKTVYTMPYPNYHHQVDKVFESVFQVCSPLDPYARLPEDPPDAQPVSVISTPEDFERATLTQVCRYLMLCRRAERFCDGHIEQQFTSGMMRAAAGRLEALLDRPK